ncbi:unnamed protein product [Prorocentrum cordatum]|uniref:Calmodulin-lysine N-methyltransferase n=1 Tax=Prorocentrum cordatum TaxID=2364126 RepID=A0ABN9QFF3_9DINO|nr:unnamed protein product [Polarella glacialis]
MWRLGLWTGLRAGRGEAGVHQQEGVRHDLQVRRRLRDRREAAASRRRPGGLPAVLPGHGPPRLGRRHCGSEVLAKYLEHYVRRAPRATGPGPTPGRLRGLELGCGTGVGGLALALLGHEAVLSDIGDLQAAATQSNIDRNRAQIAAAGGEATYMTLDWRGLPARAPLGAFDLVVAADVVWHESLVEPFLQAVSWACSGPGSSEVILSHKVRDEESVQLWERLTAEAGLRIERKVRTEEAVGEDGHPDVVVYHLRKAG